MAVFTGETITLLAGESGFEADELALVVLGPTLGAEQIRLCEPD